MRASPPCNRTARVLFYYIEIMVSLQPCMRWKQIPLLPALIFVRSLSAQARPFSIKNEYVGIARIEKIQISIKQSSSQHLSHTCPTSLAVLAKHHKKINNNNNRNSNKMMIPEMELRKISHGYCNKKWSYLIIWHFRDNMVAAPLDLEASRRQRDG
jgi:hypothetical protein